MTIELNVEGAPVEMLDIGDLVVINDSTRKVDDWLIRTFFPNPLGFERKEVPVGEIKTTTPLAPFVSPKVAGRQIKSDEQGEVFYVKPAYLKPKLTVEPTDVYDNVLVQLMRQAGYIAMGTNRLTLADKLLVDQAQKYRKLRESIDNRRLLMARDTLLYGQTTFASDDFPEYLVDFRRSAACTFTPAVKWDQANADPVTDIERMIEIAVDEGGVSPTVAVMSSKVFGALFKNAKFKEQFITPYAGISVVANDVFTDPLKPQSRGTFGNIQFWTYDAKFTIGSTQDRFIPADYFALVSDTNGYVAHCAIQNIKAFGQPLAYFDSQWLVDDPSSLQMMCESSPLIVPDNKNGVVGGTGFVTI